MFRRTSVVRAIRQGQ